MNPIDWSDFDLDDIGTSAFSDYSTCKGFASWIETEPAAVPIDQLISVCKSVDSLKAHITEVYHYKIGCNDELPWRLLGKMTIGAIEVYFYLHAECDYTGFGCKGHIEFLFASSLNDVIRFGMTAESRSELKLY